MKQISIISGKGGTGKTTITAALFSLSKNFVVADGDVDAADLHLILSPKIKRKEEFYGGRIPIIDRKKCTECGECERVCRFDAIKNLEIDYVSCEGCGFCYNVCPSSAIKMVDNLSGYWYISDTRFGPMVHAELNVGEENSGKLVTVVRQQAKIVAEDEGKEAVLIDGPPGIGCPVIAAVTGVDYLLCVSEPTLSGIHDLSRVLDLASHFGIKAFVCINKYDVNVTNTKKIERYCDEKGVPVVCRIPYSKRVVEAMVKEKTVVEDGVLEVTKEIEKIAKLLF